ncbi:glycosyltransferase family 2 protein [Syntrophomonas wolfei]|jgi:hypothetical protein|uniref:glycosyltransferase family 2 protein n=1 Tax=Syntrophomonas wolfei TaxID=863 RepID=UPI000773D9CB|nr:glycosyltransferase family 2 protein [Syntrophomonas wolfei]
MDDIIIIIPAYNEAKNIFELVKTIKEYGLNVLVIDDCSSDKTASLALMAGAMIVKHPTNMGYGVALQTGYKYALSCKYKYLVQLDGDGQHNPQDILTVLQPILDGEADLCIGSRFLDSQEYKPPYLRRLGMKLFKKILKVLTKSIITDPTSGYQAMNSKIFRYLSLDTFPDDYPDADVIYMLLCAGAKIKEVPIKMNYNNEKSMHANLFNNIYYVLKMNLLLLTYCFKNIKKIEDE